MANKENYDINSIKKLDFLEAVRLYPGMYIGSKDVDGLHHLLKEIVSNSVDEYLNGAGDQIDVVLYDDGSVSVKDNGRGIPYGKKEDGKTALELVFTEPHAGGKFLNATGESGYNSSGGEHGIGTKTVNALSDKLIVETYRDGKCERIEFVDAKVKSHTRKAQKGKGTFVRFWPSSEWLEETTFDPERIKKLLRELSYLSKGLKFVFEYKGKKEEYFSENGLIDYLDYLLKEEESDYIIKPIYLNRKEGNFQLECGIGYSDKYSTIERLYTNNIPQEKGTHLTGFRTAWTNTLNNYAREKGWLKAKDKNLSGDDLSEGQILILNFRMINPVFKGQNKEELSSTEGKTYCQKFTTAAIEEWCIEHEADAKIIIEKALDARRASDAARKAKESARNVKVKKRIKNIDLPTKLVDAWSKKRNECECYIVEGDSAGGGLIAKRNPEFQAIFPVRGKVLNCFKASKADIYANQEINNLVKSLGLQVDKNGKLIYDEKALRYGKIIIAADKDDDGMDIRLLVITAIWYLCPELLLNGHVYVAEPPLYKVTTNKNEYIFLSDDRELDKYKEKNKKQNYIVSRNKGLGEQDPEELAECILYPETRNIRMVDLNTKNYKESERLLEITKGKDVPIRRKYLLDYYDALEKGKIKDGERHK